MANDWTKWVLVGDQHANSGQWDQAEQCYNTAWNTYAKFRTEAAQKGTIPQFDTENRPVNAFWLLMSSANAFFQLGQYDNGLEPCMVAYNLFKDVGFIAGNPFFHLRVGQFFYETGSPEERNDRSGQAVDNLARALICGGIEIFQGEDPKYIEPVLAALRPPEGFKSWQEATGQGCSMHLLNGATGYLNTLFTSKYGNPPPYPTPPE